MGEWLAFTFALTGRREWDMVPRALPWAGDLLGFQPAQGRRQGFLRTISPPLNISILNTLSVMAKVWANDLLLLLPPREVDYVICSRPRIVLPPAASSATAGRE